MKNRRRHCWHLVGSTTDGMAARFEHNERCCHCGNLRTRRTRMERDPDHGPHAPQTVEVNVSATPVGPCQA